MALWLLVYSNPAGLLTLSSIVMTSSTVNSAVMRRWLSSLQSPMQPQTVLPLTSTAVSMHGIAGRANLHVGRVADLEPDVVVLKQPGK
jgi:hypothetical protein